MNTLPQVTEINKEFTLESIFTKKGELFYKKPQGPFYDITDKESWFLFLGEELHFKWNASLTDVNKVMNPLGVNITPEQFNELKDEDCPPFFSYNFSICTEKLWDIKTKTHTENN